MLKSIVTAAAAFAASTALASAAVIVDVEEPFAGSQTGEAGVFYDADFGNETQFRYDISAASGVSYAGSFTSDGLQGVLSRIRVGVGSMTSSFADFTGAEFQPDFEAEGGLSPFQFGSLFTSFGPLAEDFSVFVQILDGPEVNQSFSLNFFAASTDDVVIPLPGAGILLASALGGFAIARRRRAA